MPTYLYTYIYIKKYIANIFPNACLHTYIPISICKKNNSQDYIQNISWLPICVTTPQLISVGGSKCACTSRRSNNATCSMAVNCTRMPQNILKPNCWLYPVNVNKTHACQCQHWPITYLIHEWSLTKCRSNLVTSKFGWLNIDSDQHLVHGTEKSIYTHTQLQNRIRIYGAARVWAAPPGVSIVSALQLWIARDHPSLSRCQP